MITDAKSLNISREQAMASIHEALSVNRNADEFTTLEYAEKYQMRIKQAYNELMRGVDSGMLERRQIGRKTTIFWRKK